MEDQEIKKVLAQMVEAQKKSNSLRLTFWRGVFYGFGVFVGSAVLVALLIYVLTRLNVDGNTFLGKIIHKILEIVSKSKS